MHSRLRSPLLEVRRWSHVAHRLERGALLWAESPEEDEEGFLNGIFRIFERAENPIEDQDFSLADAVSFAVMSERRISKALTLDHHFSVAGSRQSQASGGRARRDGRWPKSRAAFGARAGGRRGGGCRSLRPWHGATRGSGSGCGGESRHAHPGVDFQEDAAGRLPRRRGQHNRRGARLPEKSRAPSPSPGAHPLASACTTRSRRPRTSPASGAMS